jgi:hypothetical protein
MSLTNDQGKSLNRIWVHLDKILNEIAELEGGLGPDETLHSLKFRILAERNNIASVTRRLNSKKPRVPSIGD